MGSVFTYYLKDDIKTLKEKRADAEKEKIKNNQPVYYPSIDSLRLEDEEQDPYLLFTITDESGNVIRKIKTAPKKGLKRIVWNFRYAAPGAVTFTTPDLTNPYDVPETGHLALPGNYKVTLSKYEDGKITELVAPQNFTVKALNAAKLVATDKKALDAFCRKVSELQRVVSATDAYRSELMNKIKYIKTAILDAPSAMPGSTEMVKSAEKRLTDVNTTLNGDATLAKREFETVPSISGRVGTIEYTLWNTSSAPTTTFMQSYDVASSQLAAVLTEVKSIDEAIKGIEAILEKGKAPYTPGRLPVWEKK